MKFVFIILLLFQVSNGHSQNKIDSILQVVSDHIPTYFYCDGRLCKGHIVSYYANGQIKAEGHFKKGNPKRYKTYFPSGSIEMDQYYRHKKLKTSYFYSLDGLLNRKIDFKKRLTTLFYYDAVRRPVKKVITSTKDWTKVMTVTYIRVDNKWIRQ